MVAKKANDSDIIILNSIGLSLMGIGKRLGIHYTSVARRLRDLNIKPYDTRHSFMEDIFDRLNPEQRKWLVDQLGPNRDAKDFVYSLIVNRYSRTNPKYKGSPDE